MTVVFYQCQIVQSTTRFCTLITEDIQFSLYKLPEPTHANNQGDPTLVASFRNSISRHGGIYRSVQVIAT